MKQKQLVTAMALASSLALLAGCDSGDDVSVNLGSDSSSDGGNGGSSSGVTAPENCPTGTSGAVDTDAGAVCVLEGRIEQNVTLSSDYNYLLDGEVVIGNGDAELTGSATPDEYTLTIEAGTEVFGENDSYLVITRGSKINAAGTAENPITFSSVDEGYEGAGEWGGVVLMGFARTNADDGSGNVLAEAVGETEARYYGGSDNDDNSGIMQYVRITEGGYEVKTDEEINGLTLFGVGRGTTLDHIQVNSNQDDGIEFFGGTARVSHLVLTGNLDDSIDWDLGFQGNIQYALVTKVAESGYGMETDNDGSDFDKAPRSRPTLANVTIVGAAGADAGAKHREGTGAFVHNSIYTGDDECLDVDDQSSEITNSELVYNNVIFNCAANTSDDDDDGAGNEYADAIVSAGGVIQTDPQLDANYKPASGDAQLGAAVDFQSTPVTGGINTATDFLENTDYLGAVDPNASAPFWYEGWTLEGSL